MRGEMPAPHIWTELVRATEGAEPPNKGGAPKRGIAQEYDITATMRACRALTWDGMREKTIVGAIAKWFGVSDLTVHAKTRAKSARRKNIRSRFAGQP